MYSKHRIEALSDAVFAIAMTLLILEIKVPETVPPGGLPEALKHDLHNWVSFLITFMLTSIFWVFQHRVFERIEEFRGRSLFLTFVFLGLVTITPFSTALWGHHISDRFAYMIYFMVPFLMALSLTLKLELARMRGHVRPGRETEELRLRLAFMSGIMGTAMVATRLMPIQYLSLAILPVALAAQYFRRKQKGLFDEIASGPGLATMEHTEL